MRHFALPALLAGAALVLLSAIPASASTISAATLFADRVVSYNPAAVGKTPGQNYRGTGNALGMLNYRGTHCASQGHCTYTSLGRGGSITLEFTNNKLTGSGDAKADLWIFEVGPDMEDTFVEISKDGNTWFDVGKVFGSKSGVDLDAFGFGLDDVFSFVRLTDDQNEGLNKGITVGADIDAVAALSTVLANPGAQQVPGPGALALIGMGLLWLGVRSRRRPAYRSVA